MNVKFDNFSRFYKAVYHASVQQLKNESPYMIAMVISYIVHRNNETGQIW
jgi:hypothetical protein